MAGKPKLIAVVGPTASGKTSLAIALCRAFSGEVISFDSMQVYGGMPIGTAQPTAEETAGIPHRLVGCLSPQIPFSCAEYVKMARAEITDVLAAGHTPVLCGGTGLYLDSLLRGGSFEETAVSEDLRRELEAYAEQYGGEALWERLRAVDPESAAATHKNNRKRVIRALEIYETTGKRKSDLDRASRAGESPYETLTLGVRYASREVLWGRINARVDAMLAAGLVEETKRLQAEGVFAVNATAAQAIGYKELFPYLAGEESLEAGAERLKLATRHYAKRQMTWFSANPDVVWLEGDRDGAARPACEVASDAVKTAAAFLGARGNETD